MKMSLPVVRLLRPGLIGMLFGAMMLFYGSVHSAPTTKQLLSKVSTFPTTFYSPQAFTYFSQKGTSLPSQTPPSEVTKSLQMVIRLAANGNDAKEIIPILLTTFPRAVHVTEVRNVNYRGEGTFNDWVYTYVAGEKNKFLLSSPFLDYPTMSLCENFIESHHDVALPSGEPITRPTRKPVNITVTHTLYPAAYALFILTGQQIGTDQVKWQEWWRENSETYSGPPANLQSASGAQIAMPAAFGKLHSGQQFSDILIHGKYQLALTTGSFLTGKVESKTDTSLVIECTDGKAYSLSPSLISRFEQLAAPPAAVSEETQPATADESLPFSFDELRGKRSSNRIIEVRVNSGMVFRGRCKSITADQMELDVGGSTIPISRDVTLNVRFVPKDAPAGKTPKAKAAPAKNTVLDTVYEKNTETDDWGVPGPDILNAGTIISEKPENVTIRDNTSGTEKTIPRGRIVRIIKHSANTFDSEIKRYAQPLFCPQDMFIVDVPLRQDGKPFFKVCVDRYEYPNVQGTVPKTGISYDEAKVLCSQKGKRLCTADEWQYACGGLEGYTYPYGWNPEKDKCNTNDKLAPEESGARHNCVSKFGGYDMVGNVFEWVTDSRKQPATMGGPLSKCQTVTGGVGSSPKPRVGFRCCKSN